MDSARCSSWVVLPAPGCPRRRSRLSTLSRLNIVDSGVPLGNFFGGSAGRRCRIGTTTASACSPKPSSMAATVSREPRRACSTHIDLIFRWISPSEPPALRAERDPNDRPVGVSRPAQKNRGPPAAALTTAAMARATESRSDPLGGKCQCSHPHQGRPKATRTPKTARHHRTGRIQASPQLQSETGAALLG